MESDRFDALARTVSSLRNRRALIHQLGVGTLAAAVATVVGHATTTEAKKRRGPKAEHNVRGNKAIMCYQGKTVRKPKKQRNKWLKRGATRGACEGGCTPVCPAGSCGGDDGCGGVCPGCQAGSVCVGEVCQECSVACTGSATECGDSLREAIDGGGAVYLCPGNYEGPFIIGDSVEVYGAGNGDDPGSSSILMMPDPTEDRVVTIGGISVVALNTLRITGGNVSAGFVGGGGVLVGGVGSEVTLTDCVISGNETAYYGGGVYHQNGALTIVGCEISNNTSDAGGGGIAVDRDMTVIDTVISGNTATGFKYGGGIYIDGGTTTITGDVLFTQNTADYGGGIYGANGTMDLAATVTITENTATTGAGGGGGIYTWGATINPNGAVVTNNNPDDCVNVVC